MVESVCFDLVLPTIPAAIEIKSEITCPHCGKKIKAILKVAEVVISEK